MMQGKNGKHGRVICSCGSRSFPRCPINDETKNPLVGILGRDKVRDNKCCLIKEDEKKQLKLGKKVKTILQKNAIKKIKRNGQHSDRPVLLSNVMTGSSNNIPESDTALDPHDLKMVTEESKHPESRKKSPVDDIVDEFSQLNDGTDSSKLRNEYRGDEEEHEGGSDDDLNSLFGGESARPMSTIGEHETRVDEERYQNGLLEYTTTMFISDLTKVLIFDESEIKKNCPKLVEKDYMIFDETLQRKVHLFEHIILLASGF